MVITLATPFFNAEKYLSLYFEHLLKIDYPTSLLNLVFCDNESTDHTLCLLKKFCIEHQHEYNSISLISVPRIRNSSPDLEYLITQLNIIEVRNAIIKASKNDLIFIDGDCFPPPDAVFKLLAMRDYYKADICGGVSIGGRLTFCATVGKFAEDQDLMPVGKIEGNKITIPRYEQPIFKVEWIGHGLILICRKVFDKLKYEFSQGEGEDLFFCYRANLLGFRLLADISLWYEHYRYNYTRKTTKNKIIITIHGVRMGHEPLLPSIAQLFSSKE